MRENMEQPSNEQYFLLDKVMSKLVHDLSGILVSMRMKRPVLVNALPHLLSGYQLAVNHQLMSAEIKEKHLNLMSEVADIEPELTEMLDLINDVNHMCHDLNVATDVKDSVLVRVKYVMGLLDIQDKKLITIDDSLDCPCSCSLIFFDALIQNITENSLYAIGKAERGDIRIWLSKEDEGFVLNIKDTAYGMDEAQLSTLFDRFLSKRDTKILPGLGFCREALRSLGGDVNCASEDGAFTHFKIVLP